MNLKIKPYKEQIKEWPKQGHYIMAQPNFLWMMYRNGWGTKEGQETVLAIHIKREAFEKYLKDAVYSSFQSDIYSSHDDWKTQVKESNIRLQWDPDHDPYGAKLERRAIQLGIRGDDVIKYAKEDIIKIEDISDFVNKEYQKVLNNDLDTLLVPEEKPYYSKNEDVNKRLRLK